MYGIYLKTDISKKESYVVGTLNNNNVNQFYYDSKDKAIKFEQTPDIYYSLLLEIENNISIWKVV